MAVKETILTAEGLKKLQDELEFLENVKRPEITQRLKEARAQGDLSENAEYEQAREDQSFNEGKILELKELIKTAKVIDASEIERGKVSLGSVVVLKDLEFGEEEEYSIVGTTEADPFENRISNESPVGRAILGQQVGYVASVSTPAGELKYEIISIK